MKHAMRLDSEGQAEDLREWPTSLSELLATRKAHCCGRDCQQGMPLSLHVSGHPAAGCVQLPPICQLQHHSSVRQGWDEKLTWAKAERLDSFWQRSLAAPDAMHAGHPSG